MTGTLNTSSTETYKFPTGSNGAKVDLGADNKVRYVDGTAVYTTGYNAGYAQTKTVAKEYVNLLYNHSVSNTTKTWSTASGYVTSKSTKSDVRKYGATHTGSSSKITLVDTINSKPALVYSLSFTYQEESDIPTGGASGSADVYIYLYDSNNNQLASFRGKTTNAKTKKSHTITILPLNYNIATDEIYVKFRLESDAKGRGSSHSSTSVWLQLDSSYTITYYTPVA